MPKEFETPSFLPEEVKIEPSRESHVVGVTNLPENINRKFPEGIVIKQVDDNPSVLAARLGGDYWDASSLLYVESGLRDKGHKPNIEQVVNALKTEEFEYWRRQLSKDGKPVTADRVRYLHKLLEPESIAQHFKQRQDFYRQFFYDVLPELVVDSLFIIGKGKGSKPNIYEIQPKITDYLAVGSSIFTSSMRFPSEGLSSWIRNKYTEEQVKSIYDQLKKFRIKYEELYVTHGRIADLSGDNLIITKDGQLKYIDTNELFDEKLGYKHLMPNSLPRLDKLIEALA